MIVVIGTSAFNDTSVATGPFASARTWRARVAVNDLQRKGYVVEIVDLQPVDEIGTVVNDEGKEED